MTSQMDLGKRGGRMVLWKEHDFRGQRDSVVRVTRSWKSSHISVPWLPHLQKCGDNTDMTIAVFCDYENQGTDACKIPGKTSMTRTPQMVKSGRTPFWHNLRRLLSCMAVCLLG